jgi:hypothetical protein
LKLLLTIKISRRMKLEEKASAKFKFHLHQVFVPKRFVVLYVRAFLHIFAAKTSSRNEPFSFVCVEKDDTCVQLTVVVFLKSERRMLWTTAEGVSGE